MRMLKEFDRNNSCISRTSNSCESQRFLLALIKLDFLKICYFVR
jgi:hypothetical protein